MQFIPKLAKPGRNFCEGHNLTVCCNLGEGASQSGFFFSPSNLGVVVDPEQNSWIILLL